MSPSKSSAKPKAKKRNADAAAAKERQLAPLREHAYRPGQSGNPHGRPKGARNKLTTQFFEDFYEAWQQHGPEAIKRVAESNPKDFVKAAAMLMPRELELKAPLDDLSDNELTDLIAAVQSLIATSSAVAAAGGNRAASKPH